MERTIDTSVTIRSARYCVSLLVVAVVLVMTHLGLNLYHHEVAELPWLLRQLFELDEENNIPTWFSSFLLLNDALVLVLVAYLAGSMRWYWLCLASGFLILAIDEVAGLHETFHTAIDFNWTIAGAVVVGLAGLAFIPFIRALDKHRAVWFVLSGLVFVSGALGVEFLSKDLDEDTVTYVLAVAVEEGMEMAGALMFLWVNVRWLSQQQASVTLRFSAFG